MLRGVSAESGHEMHFVGTPVRSSMVTIKARLVPEIAFPWRARSLSPVETRSVAWVVPCGAAPCESAGSSVATSTPSLILVDVAQPSTGHTPAVQGASATGGR